MSGLRRRDRGTTARSSLARARARSAWLFLTPTLLALALVALWPLARTVWFGFTDAQLAQPRPARFVGLDNFLARVDGEWFGVLADADWWAAVGNTLWFTAVSVSLETVLGLVVALVLHADFRGRGLVRAAVLVPWAIPTVVSAKMWSWMLNDQFGVINHALLALHLIDAPVAWTANPATALWAVVIVDVWKTTPFMALLLLAGLQMLPADCYEAARVDGIHPLRVFDLVYVITGNTRETMTMSVYARQQLVDFQDVGAGSAASTLLFLVVAVLVAVTLTASRVRLGAGEGVR